MEKRKNLFCAKVIGNEEDLNRAALKEAFSKFGNVTKVFIDANFTYAKVYLDDLENIKVACNQLNGVRSWEVNIIRDDYKAKNTGYGSPDNSFVSRSRTSLNQSLGGSSSNGNADDMEEECVFAGDYVDVNGKPVEVLQGENGMLYVNLKDIRPTGYNIYKREVFDNAMITKDVDLRHLKLYLLNQAKKYILDAKKMFNEVEMMTVMERVEEKLLNKPVVAEFGEGRIINSSPNNRNFSITKSNVPSTSPASSSRASSELPENYRPSFSHVKPKGKRSDDRQNGPPHSSNGPRHSYEDRNDNRNEDRKKTLENNPGSTEVNPSHQNKRKPMQNYDNKEVAKNIRSKALAYSNANEEVEESWEGEKTSVPKSKPQSDTLLVSSERKTSNVDRTVLVPNGLYKIKVSYIKPDKKSLFYSQWVENLNQIQEILLHVNTEDLKLPEIVAPARDKLCIAYFEGCWYRAIVLQGKYADGGAFVELIDYGNKEVIKTPLREISEEMKKIPGMAIRTAAHYNSESDILTLSTEQELEVFVKKHYDDLTHLVEIKRILDVPKLDQDPPTPPSEVSSDQEQQRKPVHKPAVDAAVEDPVMEVPASTVKLVNGESVMIVSYTEKNFVLRNRETASSCKALYEHINKSEKKPIANPKVGQLVLCIRDGLDGFHRAVIKKIVNPVAEVEYIDHKGEETLALKSLKRMDKSLAVYPIATVDSPEVGWLKKVTKKSDRFLNNLIMNKTKLQVVLDGPKFDLSLTVGDQTTLLSNIIENLDNPPKEEPKVPVVKEAASSKSEEAAPSKSEEAAPSKSKEAAPSKSEEAAPSKSEKAPIPQALPKKKQPAADQYIKITYDDMPFVKAKLGIEDFICYNCKEGSIVLLPSTEAAEYIECIDITEPSDTLPYEPELWEMCLGKSEEGWYRATVTETNDGTCDILFVDFGNTETVPTSDIRRFPKELAEIPILGVGAYFVDIPDDPKIHNRLKDLIPDESLLSVNVKTALNDELKHGIEIPSVYEVLRKENLI